MRNHAAVNLLAVVLALIALTGCATNQAKVRPQPPEVLFTPVIARDLPMYVDAVGQTKGSKEVQITPRVSGFVLSQDYKDGAIVKKGQLLYTLDARPFQAALEQAKGRLAQAKAVYEKAKNDVIRYQPLAAEDAISRQQFDNARSNEQAAAAAVEAAKASVQAADINLGYTRIYSPVAGLAAISNVTVGTLVGNGQNNVLTVVSAVQPILVRFPISEREYLEYRRKIPNEQAAQNSRPDIRMTLADGTLYRYPGRLTAADALVDAATGTLTLEAEFPNPNFLLRPGQYARIRIQSQVIRGAILVPQRAVQEVQGSYTVAVVGADSTIEERPVQLGSTVGGSWVVQSGLKGGDRVVVEGNQRLRDGVRVNAKAATAASETADLSGDLDGAK